MINKLEKNVNWIGKTNVEIKFVGEKFLSSELLKNYCKELGGWITQKNDIISKITKVELINVLLDETMISFVNDKKWLEKDFNVFNKKELNINEAIIDNLTKHYVMLNMYLISAAWIFVNSSKKTRLKDSLSLFENIEEFDFINSESSVYNSFIVFETEMIKSKEFKKAIKEIVGLESFVKKCQESRRFFELMVNFIKYKKENAKKEEYDILDFFYDVLLLKENNDSLDIDVSDLKDEELKEVGQWYKTLKENSMFIFERKTYENLSDVKIKELRHLLGNYTMIANFELAKREKLKAVEK